MSCFFVLVSFLLESRIKCRAEALLPAVKPLSICVDCLFSSWQPCTADRTTSPSVLLSSRHTHSGTTLLDSLGYHIPPSLHRIPDYRCNTGVHLGRKSNRPDCWNQIRALPLFAGKLLVLQLKMTNTEIRRRRTRMRMRRRTAGLKTWCYFCSSCHCESRRPRSWHSVLRLSWVPTRRNSLLSLWAWRILFPAGSHYS